MSDLSISPTLKYPRNKLEIQNSKNTNNKEHDEMNSEVKYSTRLKLQTYETIS